MLGTLYVYDIKEDTPGDNKHFLTREGEFVICPYCKLSDGPVRCGSWCAQFDIEGLYSENSVTHELYLVVEGYIKTCHNQYKMIEWSGHKKDAPERITAFMGDHNAAKRARRCESKEEVGAVQEEKPD